MSIVPQQIVVSGGTAYYGLWLGLFSLGELACRVRGRLNTHEPRYGVANFAQPCFAKQNTATTPDATFDTDERQVPTAFGFTEKPCIRDATPCLNYTNRKAFEDYQ